MRKAIAAILFCLPGALAAQLPLTVSPQQCVWRAGDNPAWAAPALDESGWQPYSSWTLSYDRGQIWVRCKADFEALRGLQSPAIQIDASSAYDLYVNGRRVGSFGNLKTGNSSMDRTRSWPLPKDVTAAPGVIAMRLVYRSQRANLPATIRLGGLAGLKALRDSIVLASARADAGMAACYIVIGAIGFALLGFYLADRSRSEILLLGLSCIALAGLRLDVFAINAQAPFQRETSNFIFQLFNLVLPIAETLFFFRLARRRIPLVLIVLLSLTSLWVLLICVMSMAPVGISLKVQGWLFQPDAFIALLVASMLNLALAPMLAFLPVRSIPPRIRLLAVLCGLWCLFDAVWMGVEMFSVIPGFPNLFQRWYTELAESRGFALLAIVVALMALLLRDQRQVFEERALLAGEMQAAREIQKMLAPETLCTAPGFAVEVAFRPMREVGGDFYLCRPLGDGRQRLLVGDVSGKGAAAAMTAALILGAAEDHSDYAPPRLLAHIDRVLGESRVGGFATCLCADLASDGTVTLANAGHLPPYSRGQEIAIPASLPLGVNHGQDFQCGEIVLRLGPGESLTFLSDGVVEARADSGELFGFDRARTVSQESAEEIATAAQSFGQQDDITVLRLTRCESAEMTGGRQPATAFTPA